MIKTWKKYRRLLTLLDKEPNPFLEGVEALGKVVVYSNDIKDFDCFTIKVTLPDNVGTDLSYTFQDTSSALNISVYDDFTKCRLFPKDPVLTNMFFTAMMAAGNLAKTKKDEAAEKQANANLSKLLEVMGIPEESLKDYSLEFSTP